MFRLMATKNNLFAEQLFFFFSYFFGVVKVSSGPLSDQHAKLMLSPDYLKPCPNVLILSHIKEHANILPRNTFNILYVSFFVIFFFFAYLYIKIKCFLKC